VTNLVVAMQTQRAGAVEKRGTGVVCSREEWAHI
jgi:hypothetical protein